jgi:threonine aldolase
MSLEETLSTRTSLWPEIIARQSNASIDLRSDTVTRPTPAMRAAMAAAEVGDDVYGEDPTVNLLEERAAEIFGREAGLFVPTGTMGNQIAIRMHTEHGQEVICESRGHLVDWEMAMVSAFSGCQLRTVYADRGVLTWDLIQKAVSSGLHYRSRTGLISIENTHNMAGGTVMPLEVAEEMWLGAADAGLPVHLDGARIFNAATALATPVDRLTSGFSSVMFCLSKGLCAPVGSMLVSSRKNIERARGFRKALGGGMRQVGVLAAAGLVALNEMTGRLQEDHDNAKLLAGALSKLPQVDLDPELVQTNIVIFRLRDRGDAQALVRALESRGVLAGTVGADSVRLVTHHDVDRAACERAGAILVEEIQKWDAW